MHTQKFVLEMDSSVKKQFKSANLSHRPLYCKKIKKPLTQHSQFSTQQSCVLTAIAQHLILNLPHPYLNFQVSLIDLSQPDIQILYGLQIDDGIQQCVNSSSTGIFKNKFVVHGIILVQLHHFSFHFIKNGNTTM